MAYRPQQLRELLATSFANRKKVLVKGKPGIGKTDIVMQACQDVGADLFISHPAISDPTDYKGMPAIIDGGTRAEFLPFGDLSKLIEATKLTVCFQDDLGQAAPAVQAALMQLNHGRRVNGHRISDHVIFVGATNDTTHMAGVSGLIEPLKSRWDTIVELDCHLDDWCSWALDNAMPPELIAFIRFRPNLLCDFKPTRELKNSPCPRTVAAVGGWLNIGVKDYDVIAGAAGEAFATELVGFLSMYADLPSLDTILMDPEGADLPTIPSANYAVITGLATKTTPANAERAFRYAKRLEKEFEVCYVRDITRLDKTRKTGKVCQTPTYVAWATKNAGVLS